MTNQPMLDQQTMDLILTNQTARLDLVKKSHKAFFATYFSHYLSFPSAQVHQDMLELTENDARHFGIVMTFRGSAKSTIVSLSYPIWAILGRQEKHLIVLVSKTQEQARKLLDSIKREFESNDLLQRDFGAIHEESTPWNSTALTFEGKDAQIVAVSIDQSIRGIRYKNFRPDVFVLDDIEDVLSVRTKESRDKLEMWLETDLLPAGDIGTRTILVGNNLHPDSVPNRLIEKVENDQFDARVIRVPLVDKHGNCTWPGKFPTQESLDQFRRRFTSARSWKQEYLLQPVLSNEQPVEQKDIHYYDELPDTRKHHCYAAIGIDLACSMSNSADKTAFVPALVFGSGPDMKIYVLSGSLNKRLIINDSLDACLRMMNRISTNRSDGKGSVRVFVEAVAFQKTYVQQLQAHGVKRVEEYHPIRIGKHERLLAAASLIKSGQVLFPRTGAQELIGQIVGYGIEKHDDLTDAFTTLTAKAIEHNPACHDFGIATGDLYRILTPEQARLEQESQAHEARVHEEAIDYWAKVQELHRRGEVPPLQ